MGKFKIGDVVYYFGRRSECGFATIIEFEFNKKLVHGIMAIVRYDDPIKPSYYRRYIECNKPVKVDPDTPQNRLAIQIKYGN